MLFVVFFFPPKKSWRALRAGKEPAPKAVGKVLFLKKKSLSFL